MKTSTGLYQVHAPSVVVSIGLYTYEVYIVMRETDNKEISKVIPIVRNALKEITEAQNKEQRSRLKGLERVITWFITSPLPHHPYIFITTRMKSLPQRKKEETFRRVQSTIKTSPGRKIIEIFNTTTRPNMHPLTISGRFYSCFGKLWFYSTQTVLVLSYISKHAPGPQELLR